MRFIYVFTHLELCFCGRAGHIPCVGCQDTLTGHDMENMHVTQNANEDVLMAYTLFRSPSSGLSSGRVISDLLSLALNLAALTCLIGKEDF